MADGEVERTRTSRIRGGLPGVFEVSWQAEKRWTDRTRSLGERVRALTERTSEQLAAAAAANETVADVVQVVTQRAVEIGDDEYAEALSRALALAFEDDTQVDEVAYLCAELTKLEPLHLRGLRAFTAVNRAGRIVMFGQRSRATGMNTRNVARRAGVSGAVASSILSRLEAAGFVHRHLPKVTSNVTQTKKGVVSVKEPVLDVDLPDRWSLTDWGDHVVRTLILSQTPADA